jgi:hypothetical protein
MKHEHHAQTSEVGTTMNTTLMQIPAILSGNTPSQNMHFFYSNYVVQCKTEKWQICKIYILFSVSGQQTTGTRHVNFL